jgi:hypothetical protein
MVLVPDEYVILAVSQPLGNPFCPAGAPIFFSQAIMPTTTINTNKGAQNLIFIFLMHLPV